MFVPELPQPGLVLAATGRTLTVVKPDAGSPLVFRLEPGDTLDLQPIANENITLVKLGNRLVVLFADRGFFVLDGLYLPDGTPSSEVNVNFAPGTTLSAVQFATQFPISTDTEILTAAGINVGPLGSGGINLAAAPPGSALQPISDLTPGTDIIAQVFGLLPPSSSVGSDGVFGAAPPNLPTFVGALAAVNDAGSVSEAGVQPGNTPFAGTPAITGSLIANDSGLAPLVVVGAAAGVVGTASGNLGVPIAGTYGSATLSADGTFAFALDNADLDTNALAQGQNVQEIFTYTVQDAFGQTSTAQLIITVTGTNDAPIITLPDVIVPDFEEREGPADAFSGTVIEAGSGVGGPIAGITAATGQIAATDVDNGAILTFSGNARGIYGDFVIDPVTGIWTYTLDNSDPDTQALASGDFVQEQFTVTVTDEFGATDTASVTVNILGTNDAARLDLDATNAGVNYQGLSDAEAARSTADPRPANGASIVQNDDGTVPVYQFAADAAGGVREVRATVSDTATGSRGRLDIDMSLASPEQISPTETNVAGDTFAALTLGGPLLTQQQVDFFLQNLRYINDETSFALDTSDREIVVTMIDASGITHTATAFIPVIADVSDTTGLDAFTGTRFGDRILGLGGDDEIDGGEGDNVIDGGTGDNALSAGDGDNQIDAAEGDDTITAGNGDNVINAGDGDNTITLGNGDNTIVAGSDDDVITTGNGDNSVDAGAGDNTVTTGSGADIVVTGDGDNQISVGGGDDRVTTGAGDDRVSPGAGDNRVTTGTGADTLVFNAALSEIGLTTIVDFETGSDTLELDFNVFGAGLAAGGADTGTLDGARFVSGTSFTDANQRFLFDTSTNTLFFDADGAGAGASLALAQLESGTVVATDIRLA